MEEFRNRHKYRTNSLIDLNSMTILGMSGEIDADQQNRLVEIERAWNFYRGYHWEEIPDTDKPQTTKNYCRPFVNKFVSFELGNGFITEIDQHTLEKYPNYGDAHQKTHLSFINDVWKYSKKDLLCIELGQSKAVTGDGWLQVKYYSPDEIDDPFSEYPNGMIKVSVIPTNVVFAEYDPYDKDIITKVTIAYPIDKPVQKGLLNKKTVLEKVIYKQVWTKDRIIVTEGGEETLNIPNKYKVIPFVQIKNFPLVGCTEGIGDLEDLIPLNTELNLKESDVSEIIDYHSAPVTVVFGAKVSQLEKGANKVWGGLPKDAKVQNLELQGDLQASMNYIREVKEAMNDIGGVPKGALGGEQAISNTSGVALQFVNMPLIERTKIKRASTKIGLEKTNKLILLIGVREGLISIPQGMSNKEFYDNEVKLPDNLPKDELIELQKLESELRMGIESKENAMKRTGKTEIANLKEQIIEEKINDINIARYGENLDRATGENPENAKTSKDLTINSGMTNGETPLEVVRKEITGKNGQ